MIDKAVIAAVVAAVCAVSASVGSIMNGFFRIPEVPGSLTGGMNTIDPKNAVKSTELLSFSLVLEESGFIAPEDDLDALPGGRYELYLGPDDDGNLICRMKYRTVGYMTQNSEISVEFACGGSALGNLARLLSDIGATEINGYYASDSALGSYLNVRGEYGSGETLAIHAEGGASVTPGVDFMKVVRYFRDLASENGRRFVRRYTEEELRAAFADWCRSVIPGVSDDDFKNLSTEYNAQYGGASIRFSAKDAEGNWKWVASAGPIDTLTGVGHYARYLAAGYNDDTEVMIGDIELFPGD